MTSPPAVTWQEAEGEIDAREVEAMATHAPDMVRCGPLLWRGRERAGGWTGFAPAWGGDRPKPPGVDELLDGRRLELNVVYPEAFPAAPPALIPIRPDVPMERRTFHTWHVNGDGSLCMMQAAGSWRLENTAAELVRKASGWYIEYLLVEAGAIDSMTEAGIFSDTRLDETLLKWT